MPFPYREKSSSSYEITVDVDGSKEENPVLQMSFLHSLLPKAMIQCDNTDHIKANFLYNAMAYRASHECFMWPLCNSGAQKAALSQRQIWDGSTRNSSANDSAAKCIVQKFTALIALLFTSLRRVQIQYILTITNLSGSKLFVPYSQGFAIVKEQSKWGSGVVLGVLKVSPHGGVDKNFASMCNNAPNFSL